MADDIRRSAHGTSIGGSREEEKLDELDAHAIDDPRVNPRDKQKNEKRESEKQARVAHRSKPETAVRQDGSLGDVSPRDETTR